MFISARVSFTDSGTISVNKLLNNEETGTKMFINIALLMFRVLFIPVWADGKYYEF